MTKLSEQTKAHLLAELSRVEAICAQQSKLTILERLNNFENQLTFNELKACLSNPLQDDLEERLIQRLRQLS